VATTGVSVRKALATQEDLTGHREHCSAHPDRLAAIGRAVGQQVRVRRDGGELGLYTVSELRPQDADTTVRMGLTARRRLGTEAEFGATLDSQVPHPTMSAAEARDAGELIERLKDDGRRRTLIAVAPHGGDIERHTDQQAERVAARLAVSSWRCKGWAPDPPGASLRWHVTSADLSEGGFPLLARVISRGFAYAVSFHGFDDEPGILIGGTAPGTLKEEIREAVEGATGGEFPARVAGEDEHYGGDDPNNVVNRLTAGGANGIQIEQSLPARQAHWRAVADAVADVYARRLHPRDPDGDY